MTEKNKNTGIILGYRTIQTTIGERSIVEYEELPTRREVKKIVVRETLQKLKNGNNFECPLVVNRNKEGKFQIIDGNNRFDAIKQYLAIEPEGSVEVTLHVYNNLDEVGLKEVYSTWNRGKPQSLHDIIKQYSDEIPILPWIQKSFPVPVAIYGGEASLGFSLLVSAYMAARHGGEFNGSYTRNKWQFIYDAKKLNKDDYYRMCEFIEDFQNSFGPIKNNPWKGTCPFAVTMKIWMDNIEHLGRKKIVELFRKKLANDGGALQYHKMGGRGVMSFVRGEYLKKLNFERTKNLFR